MRLLVATLLLITALPARAEVIHATAELVPTLDQFLFHIVCRDAIDFSDQTIVNCHAPVGDLTYTDDHEDPWLGLYSWGMLNGAAIMSVDVPLTDVDVAPESGYGWAPLIEVDRTYIVRTGDGLYVKLAPREVDADGCCKITIEYYVQTDGTRDFGPNLPVESSTWGRVKALYR